MVEQNATLKHWMTCALILFIGALSACTNTATPIVIPTLTLVPNTATPTPTPITPSPLPAASITAVPLTPTPTDSPFVTILQITVTPDADLTRRILRDLANSLDIDISRIQIVTIETATWFDDNLGCDSQTILDTEEASATFQPTIRIEGFRYVLLVGNTAHEYHSEGTRGFESCTSTENITDDLLIAVDPIALDMLSLVQRRLAAQLDISTRRVQMLAVEAYVWEDTSLGCPQPDQTYQPTSIPGYRIVVTAGGTDYAYHSDSTTVILCEAGQEQLPTR